MCSLKKKNCNTSVYVLYEFVIETERETEKKERSEFALGFFFHFYFSFFFEVDPHYSMSSPK